MMVGDRASPAHRLRHFPLNPAPRLEYRHFPDTRNPMHAVKRKGRSRSGGTVREFEAGRNWPRSVSPRRAAQFAAHHYPVDLSDAIVDSKALM